MKNDVQETSATTILGFVFFFSKNKIMSSYSSTSSSDEEIEVEVQTIDISQPSNSSEKEKPASPVTPFSKRAALAPPEPGKRPLSYNSMVEMALSLRLPTDSQDQTDKEATKAELEAQNRIFRYHFFNFSSI